MAVRELIPNNTLGFRIQYIRLNEHMSQKEFAESLGVTQNLISMIENNKRDISKQMADKIVEKYGYNLGWIKYGDSYEIKQTKREQELTIIRNILANLSTEKLEFTRQFLQMLAEAKTSPQDGQVPQFSERKD